MRAEILHFRGVFDITASEPFSSLDWAEIPKTVQAWIAASLKRQNISIDGGFRKRWFYVGGNWDFGPKYKVVTAATAASQEEPPEYWAVTYEHPDADFDERQWRTDIGVTRVAPDKYRFSLALVHYIRPNYIGESPKPPLPSAPGIVHRLLKKEEWIAKAGSQRLKVDPHVLRTGDGKLWQDWLFSPERSCALIFVSRNSSGSYLIDPVQLAKNLAGVAVVVEAGEGLLDQELGYLLPKALRCWNGAVRVYLPNINRDDDGRRHRYFTAERIEQLTAERVEEMIIDALARRSPLLMPGVLTTVQDVKNRRRETRLKEIGDTAKSLPEFKQWVTLLQDVNASLEQEKQTLSTDNAKLRFESDQTAAELEEAEERFAREQAVAKECRARADRAEERVRQLERTQESLLNIDLFPQNVTEIIDLAEKLYPDRLAFTERARKSAKDADITDMEAVWGCIKSMAVTLHKLYFPADGTEPERGTIPQQFNSNASLFELAPTESSATKRDAKKMKLRKDMYKDQEIDIAAHIKYKGIFRVHFYPHSGERRLIIGHCGNHLDTAGTRRRK